MGNLNCSPDDEEYMYPTLPSLRGETTKAAITPSEKFVQIELEYTPSPSPWTSQSDSRSKSRLPLRGDNGSKRKEYTESPENLEDMLVKDSLLRYKEEFRSLPQTRSISERAALKRSPSMSRTFVSKRNSVPLMVREFQENYLRKFVLKKAIEKELQSCSDIFIDMDTSRSRVPFKSPIVEIIPSPAGSNSFTWAVASKKSLPRSTYRGSLFPTLSDSQFQFSKPVLSPIFSNKVCKFVDEDTRNMDEIMEALEQEMADHFYSVSPRTMRSQNQTVTPGASYGRETPHVNYATPRVRTRRIHRDQRTASSSSFNSSSDRSVSSSRQIGGGFLLSPSYGGSRFPSMTPTPRNRGAPAWKKIRDVTTDLKVMANGCDSSQLEEFAKELELLKEKFRNQMEQKTIFVK